MRTLAKKREKYFLELSALLFKKCHAPNCKKFKRCPEQCECKPKRKFKLNYTSAACWEIAKILRLSMETTAYDINEKKKKIHTITHLMAHHATRDWEELYDNIDSLMYTLSRHLDSQTSTLHFVDVDCEYYLRCIKKQLPKLRI